MSFGSGTKVGFEVYRKRNERGMLTFTATDTPSTIKKSLLSPSALKSFRANLLAEDKLPNSFSRLNLLFLRATWPIAPET